MEIRLRETFHKDVHGNQQFGLYRSVATRHQPAWSACNDSAEKLGRRQGTFVLQGSEIVENGRIKATWFVVPASGTGALSGLRGHGGFEGQFGKGSDGTSDYWFE